MFNFYYRILSYLPSKKGKEAMAELLRFMSKEGGINFNIRPVKDETGEYFIAESINAADKHIVTSGKSLAELDHNIKDAIFSIFQVPAHYCKFDLLKSPLNQELELRYATR